MCNNTPYEELFRCLHEVTPMNRLSAVCNGLRDLDGEDGENTAPGKP
jgi:hypothetical protein